MAALSWAPSQDNQLCLISTTGKLELYPFGEDTSLSWSPHNTLAFNANTRLKVWSDGRGQGGCASCRLAFSVADCRAHGSLYRAHFSFSLPVFLGGCTAVA